MFKTEVANWTELVALGQQLSQTSWIYRGQSDQNWALTTTFERAATRWGIDPAHFVAIENRVLWDFKRRAHHYVDEVPRDDSRLEWLALLQHHGGPTRLLDFTHSFNAAVFFALEKANGTAAVWAIDPLDLGIQSRAVQWQDRIQDAQDFCNSILETPDYDKPGVCLVEPVRANDRLARQQGTFLFPTELRKTFVENLRAATKGFELLPDHDSLDPVRFERVDIPSQIQRGFISWLKILIPAGIHTSVMQQLRYTNVTAESLFGGLDGFARSLNHRVQLYDLLNLR